LLKIGKNNRKRMNVKKYVAIGLVFCILATIVPIPTKVNKVEAGAVADVAGIEDDTGGFVVDNSFDYAAGKLTDYADEIGEKTIEIGKEANIIKYAPKTGEQLVRQGGKILNVSNALKAGGQVLNLYNTSVDTYKLFTETSKQETFIEKGIDKTLYAVDIGMGWYAIVLGAAAIVTAPAWGTGVAAAATVTGTTYLVTKLGVGAARVAFNSETYRETSKFVRGAVSGAIDLATGKKKLVFSPLQNPGMREGLDIIEEELGFDLYPGLRREIPDPSTGIPVYKPNIYLYANDNYYINVKVYPEHWITASEPEYMLGTGWNASIIDGSINGEGDYLFYEAIVPDEGFQKNYGFLIKSDNIVKDIENVLEMYGFNEKEKCDFLEYWIEKLEKDTSYIFYPQQNKEVDLVMPIVLSKEPDNIFRLWFYIEPLSEENAKDLNNKIIKPDNIEKIKREGFYLIEWGGILAS